MSRLNWAAVLTQAREIVEGYTSPVTLRQVHYRLVALGTVPNTVSTYKRLSALTAQARRAGEFPELADYGRRISRPPSWNGADDALDWLRQVYRRDRTAGQPAAIYLGVEKEALVAQLTDWYGDLGLPVIALRGYSSQTLTDLVRRDAHATGRETVLLFAGDLDPSGEDLERDFLARTRCWDHAERVALTAEQVRDYDLPPQPGKPTDSRAPHFVAEHGHLMQVEVDALEPEQLHQLFNAALAHWWNLGPYETVLEAEQHDRDRLHER